MSVEVNVAAVNQFNANLDFLSQQLDSRFQGAVTTDNYIGEGGKVVEQLGAISLQEKDARHADLKQVDTPHDARWVFPVAKHAVEFVDREDQLQSLVNLEGGYAQNFMFAINRDRDLQIKDAFFGDSRTGKTGVTITSFPASQTVDSSGAGGMTTDKILEAQLILKLNEVDLDIEEQHGAIGAFQWKELMKDADIKNFDTNSVKPLSDGNLGSFLGIIWHDYQSFDIAANIRDCAIWVKSGMHLGMWNGIDRDIGRNRTKGNQQITVQVMHGATRLEEVKVVKVRNLES